MASMFELNERKWMNEWWSTMIYNGAAMRPQLPQHEYDERYDTKESITLSTIRPLSVDHPSGIEFRNNNIRRNITYEVILWNPYVQLYDLFGGSACFQASDSECACIKYPKHKQVRITMYPGTLWALAHQWLAVRENTYIHTVLLWTVDSTRWV
jgi:hypothetical protein